MGKTAFALNILRNVGIVQHLPCIYFSLESSAEQTVSRLLGIESIIDPTHMRNGKLSDNEWNRLMVGMERVGDSNVVIDDTTGITVSEMRSRCCKLKQAWGLELVIIDYLQMMRGSSIRYYDNRQQEIADISRSLKELARDLECPIIALSQLSRRLESRRDKRPMLSDLRDSGALEQDADMIMFLYRDEYYNRESARKGVAELIIAKQRYGPVGTVELYWQDSNQRFLDRERIM
jgi:replicative DNA helicase